MRYATVYVGHMCVCKCFKGWYKCVHVCARVWDCRSNSCVVCSTCATKIMYLRSCWRRPETANSQRKVDFRKNETMEWKKRIYSVYSNTSTHICIMKIKSVVCETLWWYNVPSVQFDINLVTLEFFQQKNMYLKYIYNNMMLN